MDPRHPKRSVFQSFGDLNRGDLERNNPAEPPAGKSQVPVNPSGMRPLDASLSDLDTRNKTGELDRLKKIISEKEQLNKRLKDENETLRPEVARLRAESANESRRLAELRARSEEILRTLPETRIREIESRENRIEEDLAEAAQILNSARDDARSIRERAATALEEERMRLVDEYHARLSDLKSKGAEFACEAARMKRELDERSERFSAEQDRLTAIIGHVTVLHEKAKKKTEQLESDLDRSNRTGAKLVDLNNRYQSEIKGLEREKESLGKELRAERDACQAATIKVAQLSSRNANLKEQLGSIPGFLLSRSPEVLKWLGSLEAVGSGLDWPEDVATIGDGPFDCDFMDSMLMKEEYQPCHCGVPEAGVLIVGSGNWTSEELIEHVEAAEAIGLRVYSQEMALFALQAKIDPFEAGEAILLEMGRNHPALEFLREAPFEWPNLDGLGGGGVIYIDPSSWRAESPLTSMGYRVGWSSYLSDEDRHEILGKIFRGRIQFPAAFPEHSRREWGTPGTSKRLRKIVEQLRKNIQLHQYRDNYQLAVGEWLSDLEWLRTNFKTR
jgi:hypothetical protein